MNKIETYFWIREGDNNNYYKFSSLDEIETSHWGTFMHWTTSGIVTSQFLDLNYISIYLGDKNAQLIRELNNKEKRIVLNQLNA